MKKTKALLTSAVILIAVGTGLYLILGLVTPPVPHLSGPAGPQSVTQTSVPLTQDNLLRLVNDERAKVGVAPLALDKTLTESAQWKVDDMMKFNYRGHFKPGETTDNGLDYARQALNKEPLLCKTISENLAWNTDNSKLTADQAMTWWKGSPAHYQAMINPKYTYTGFGIANSIVAEHFCET